MDPGQYSVEPSAAFATDISVAQSPQNRMINQVLSVNPSDYEQVQTDYMRRQSEVDLRNDLQPEYARIANIQKEIEYKKSVQSSYESSPEYLQLKAEQKRIEDSFRLPDGSMPQGVRNTLTIGYDVYKNQLIDEQQAFQNYSTKLRESQADGDRNAVTYYVEKIRDSEKKLSELMSLTPGSEEFTKLYPVSAQGRIFTDVPKTHGATPLYNFGYDPSAKAPEVTGYTPEQVQDVVDRYKNNPYQDFTPAEIAIVSAAHQASDPGISQSGVARIQQNLYESGIAIIPSTVTTPTVDHPNVPHPSPTVIAAPPTVNMDSDPLKGLKFTILGKFNDTIKPGVPVPEKTIFDQIGSGVMQTPLVSALTGNKTDQTVAEQRRQQLEKWSLLAAPAVGVSLPAGSIKPPTGGSYKVPSPTGILDGIGNYIDSIIGIGGRTGTGRIIPVSTAAIIPGGLVINEKGGFPSLTTNFNQRPTTPETIAQAANETGDITAGLPRPFISNLNRKAVSDYVPLPQGAKQGETLKTGLFSEEFFRGETPAQLKAGHLDQTTWTQDNQLGGGLNKDTYASHKAIPANIREAWEFKYDNSSRTGYAFIDTSGNFQILVDSGIWKSSGSETSWDQLLNKGINPLATGLNEKGETVKGTAADVANYLSTHGQRINVQDPAVINRFYDNLQAKQNAIIQTQVAKSQDYNDNILRHRYERENALPVGSLSLTQWKAMQGGDRLQGSGKVGAQVGIQELSKPEIKITQPTGEIFGMNIPVISGILAYFQPDIVTQKSNIEIPIEKTYKMGGVDYHRGFIDPVTGKETDTLAVNEGEPIIGEKVPVGLPVISSVINPLTGEIETTTTQEYEQSVTQPQRIYTLPKTVTVTQTVTGTGKSGLDKKLDEDWKEWQEWTEPYTFTEILDIPFKAGADLTRKPGQEVGWLPSDTLKTYFTEPGKSYVKDGQSYTYNGPRPYLDVSTPLNEIQKLGMIAGGKKNITIDIANLNPFYLQNDKEMLAKQQEIKNNPNVMFSEVLPAKMDITSFGRGLWDLPHEDPIGAATYYALPIGFGGAEGVLAWGATKSNTVKAVTSNTAVRTGFQGVMDAMMLKMGTDLALDVPGYETDITGAVLEGKPAVRRTVIGVDETTGEEILASQSPQAVGVRAGADTGLLGAMWAGSAVNNQIGWKSVYKLPQQPPTVIDIAHGKLTDVMDIWTNPSSWRNTRGILQQPVRGSDIGIEKLETRLENAPNTLSPINQVEAPMSQDLVAGIVKAGNTGEIKIKGSVPVSSMSNPEIIPTGEHGVKLFGKDVDVMVGRGKGVPEAQTKIIADEYNAKYKAALEAEGFTGEVSTEVLYPETWSKSMFGVSGNNRVTGSANSFLTRWLGEANPEKSLFNVKVDGAMGGKTLKYSKKLTPADIGIVLKISTTMSPPGKNTGRVSWWGMVREPPALGEVPNKGLGTMLFGDSALMREKANEYAKLPVEGSVKGDSSFINRMDSQKMGVYFREQMSDIDLIRKVGTRGGKNWYNGNENIGKRVYGMKGVIAEKRADLLARTPPDAASQKEIAQQLKILNKYDNYINQKVMREKISLRKTPNGKIEEVSVKAEYEAYRTKVEG
jgi:hypothetical protein